MNVEMETEAMGLVEKKEIVEATEEIDIEVRVSGEFDNQLRTYIKTTATFEGGPRILNVDFTNYFIYRDDRGYERKERGGFDRYERRDDRGKRSPGK